MSANTQLDDIYYEIDLAECPCCGGTGLLEEAGGWCWYIVCMDCGTQTGHFEYNSREGRRAAAKKAAFVWNMGKVVYAGVGE